MYSIEPMSVKQFVTDSQMKLPRFQRRSVWDEKQKFELCISIFQDYPVGVVIVNVEPDSSWLLDGRQRRATLQEMRANPNALYKWAKKYIGFTPSEDLDTLKALYWAKVEDYLQKDKSDDVEQEEEVETEETLAEEKAEAASFNVEKQRKGLQTLLDVILMVHQLKSDTGKWQRAFDFTKFMRLSYAPRSNNNKVDPIKLRDFILGIVNSNTEITKDGIMTYYEDNYDLPDEKRITFEAEVDHRWEEISTAIDVIKRSERILQEANIGLIKLTNVSPLDAQNIFSRINSGGTPLKAEELLSAKPFWNEEVASNDHNLSELVAKMYSKLNVESQEGIVRWDVAATLLPRIDKSHLIFDAYKEAAAKGDLNIEQVTLGFKLLSAYYQRGITGRHVGDLEKNRSINWNRDIDELVTDLNTVFDLLLNDKFFKHWKAWGKPISKLLGSAIALEFVVIVYEDWIEKGRPTAGSASSKAVQRDARVLLDKLICEYGTGSWLGSGDRKVAYHLANRTDRLQAMPLALWEKVIEGACHGEYNGQKLARKQVTPLLYYTYVLQDLSPSNLDDVTFDIDHTIPQARFENNQFADQKLKDSLANLSLLPKRDNISKGERPLNAITDPWLKSQIVQYVGIEESEFDTFSDITHLEALRQKKQEMYLQLFRNVRESKLAY